jgi:glycosyltransferase involved in cell wall biosynthesis
MAPDRPMTVLQVIPRLDQGGAELGCVQIAEALVAAGHRSLVASAGGRMVERLAAGGTRHVTLPLDRRNPVSILLLNPLRLARLARAEAVDLIHVRSRAPAWSVLVAARLAGLPWLATFHSSYSERGRLKRLYNSVMVRGARVIAVSDWIADLIRARYAPPPGRIVTIHRVVDPAVFDPAAPDEARRAPLRARFGIGRGETVLLLAARISHRKGQDLLVEAVGRLPPAERSALRLVLAGDAQPGTDFPERLRARIAALGLAPQVVFAGHVADMPAALALADIALSCARSGEGFQRSVLEAQAMAVPVLVSDAGPGPEAVRAPPAVPPAEATGLLFRSGDVADLAAQLRRLLALPSAERRAMGARGSAWVRSTFTLERFAAATLSVYVGILDQRRAAGGPAA